MNQHPILGKLITDQQARDAIHIAVAPVESNQIPIRFLFRRSKRKSFADSDSPLTWVCGNCAWSTTVKPTATHCYCRQWRKSFRVTSDRMCFEEAA